MRFQKAIKRKAKLRIGLVGPSGSGKTFTALRIARGLGGKVAVIDTEHGSASLYADLFEFDVLELDTFSPDTYVAAINAAAEAGYDVVIIDSLSHAWMGKDGALEQVDKHAARERGNSFGAWRHVTPMHNRLVETLVGAPVHIIATMRAKTEYVIEEDSRGKKVPRKIGMAPVQRDGMEYEFTVVGDMDYENRLIVTKTRCSALAGAVIEKPGEDVAQTLMDWLEGAAPEEPKAPAQRPATVPAGSENGKRRISEEEIDAAFAKARAAEAASRSRLPLHAPKEESATPKQDELIRKMIKSHVITDEERNQIIAKLDEGTMSKSRAGDCIDWLTQTIDERKAEEKRAAAEADGGEEAA